MFEWWEMWANDRTDERKKEQINNVPIVRFLSTFTTPILNCEIYSMAIWFDIACLTYIMNENRGTDRDEERHWQMVGKAEHDRERTRELLKAAANCV